MILAIPLVFFIGGFFGWLYGQRSGRNEPLALRRLKQISRLNRRNPLRRNNPDELPTSEKTNRSTTDKVTRNASINLASTDEPSSDVLPSQLPSANTRSTKSYSASSTQIESNDKFDSTSLSNTSVIVKQKTSELDELYCLSARVKPLEYDLTQRKIEVKALKQSLQDVRRINENKLVSIRLQAENRSTLQYKEILASKQKQIDSLCKKLSDSSSSISPEIELQASVDPDQQQELKSTKQRLVGTLENLTQSEHRVAELQKEVSGLNHRLNSRSAELEVVQRSLKQSDERGLILAGRVKTLGAKAQKMDEMSRKLNDRDKEITGLTNRLKDHCAQVSELRTELNSKHGLIDAQQKKLEQIPVLEASILKSKDELLQVQERVELVESLQRALNEKDEHIVNLRKRCDRILWFESAAKTKEAEIGALREKSARAEELEKKLIEKDKRILSLQRFETKALDQETIISELKGEYDTVTTDKKILENSLIQLQKDLATANESASELHLLREKLVKSREIEVQFAQAQDKLIKAKHLKSDLDRLQSVSNELEQSQAEIKSLSESLENAELAAAAAQQNDIEVRRLRSEMQSLQKMHDNSVSKVQSLEKQIQEQQRQIITNKQLKERIRELESVESSNVRRDQQIIELKNRLFELKRNSSPNSDTPKKRLKKTKTQVPLKPIYAASMEKDDLKKINGIGPVMEKMLNSLGVTSFKQVAEFKPEDISTVTDAIQSFPGRIERDNWVAGAKEQYAKKYAKANA